MEIKTTAVIKKFLNDEKGTKLELGRINLTGKQYETVKDILKNKDTVDVTITTTQDKLFNEDESTEE